MADRTAAKKTEEEASRPDAGAKTEMEVTHPDSEEAVPDSQVLQLWDEDECSQTLEQPESPRSEFLRLSGLSMEDINESGMSMMFFGGGTTTELGASSSSTTRNQIAKAVARAISDAPSTTPPRPSPKKAKRAKK